MATPTEPPKVPDSSGGMTTERRNARSAWSTATTSQPTFTLKPAFIVERDAQRSLRIDRAFTDAKVCLIIAAAVSVSIIAIACAAWLAHWITR